MIRTIDAVKAFDTIYVISQGGPGTASETINLYLYLQAFAFYNVGNASAVVVVFFAIIVWRSRCCCCTCASARAGSLSCQCRARAWPPRAPDRRLHVAARRAPGCGACAQDRLSRSRSRVIVSPAILVFLWMLSLSLKNEIDNIAYPPVFIPDPPTLANFVHVFAQNAMGLYFRNSLIVSGCATLVALVVGVPAGYGIARLQARARSC